MAITAAQVNELRKITGAGLMDCKKALTESDGDIEGAIDLLRKKGQKVSAKRADKDATEGVVIAKITNDASTGIVIRLSSETDFVAKNDEFINLANAIADVALDSQPNSLDELNAAALNGSTVGEKVLEMVGKINENIKVTAYEKLSADTVVAYNHMGNKIGVLSGLNKAANDAVVTIGKDISMQVAALSPLGVDESSVSQDIIDKEMQLGREKAIEEGKPAEIADKIANGYVQKFLKENTLTNQKFVKDNSKTVAQVLKEVDNDLKVVDFKRIALG